MKRIILGVGLLTLTLIAAPRPADAQAASPFVGEIQMFAFNFCPSGWLPLNGQLLSISSNEVLFNLLGTQYGGDGVTTFALPKWGPIATANGQPLTVCISEFGVFPTQN